MKNINQVGLKVDEIGNVEVAQSYIRVALTGKEKDIKKVISKAIVQKFGYADKYLNVALYYGYTDENGIFKTKPLTDLK